MKKVNGVNRKAVIAQRVYFAGGRDYNKEIKWRIFGKKMKI